MLIGMFAEWDLRDANYYFLGDKYIFGSFKLAPGLVYQGGRYKNTHDESSDKILMLISRLSLPCLW